MPSNTARILQQSTDGGVIWFLPGQRMARRSVGGLRSSSFCGRYPANGGARRAPRWASNAKSRAKNCYQRSPFLLGVLAPFGYAPVPGLSIRTALTA
jgi:hypothetical protein